LVKKGCEIDQWPNDDGKNWIRFRGDPGEKCWKRLLNSHGLQGKGLLFFLYSVGTLCLVFAFLVQVPVLFAAAVVLLAPVLILFGMGALVAIFRAGKAKTTARAVQLAVIGLMVTFVIGGYLVYFSQKIWLSENLLDRDGLPIGADFTVFWAVGLIALDEAWLSLPFFVVVRELQAEFLRLAVRNMSDRFHEHPELVLVFTNTPYRDSPAVPVGIDAAEVRDVIITHMHYDHAGNLPLFPNARFHIQDTEMDYVTGRCMCHDIMQHPYEPDHVVHMVRCVFDHRVQFHDGSAEVAPGIEVHHIGGHTKGLQSVREPVMEDWTTERSEKLNEQFYANLRDSYTVVVEEPVAEDEVAVALEQSQ